ncbi:chitinase [Apiospora marii]|uniref:chitinase n=1 Tax=Apiospora marii TaxID=335849 RepID=A0ABR1RLY8_9PEZI
MRIRFSSDPWADTQINWPDASTPVSASHAYGCVKQLYLLKKAHRNVKVHLSVGGWTYSLNGRFASAVSTEPKRIQFAKSSVSLMKDWGFDGIDIDWEYPANASEAADFLALLKAVRAELDDYAARSVPGYHFRLTAAMPAGPDKYTKLPLFDMAQIVDAFNLMAYDYAGSFSPVSAHQANLYSNPQNLDSTPFSTDAAITDYLAVGVPRSKMILGMPLFGRAFENTSGLGKPYSGVDPEKDTIAGATYTFDKNVQQLISYDTPDMVKTKVDYLKSKALGGCMFWEASGDRNDTESLIRTSYSSLGALRQSQNNLHYPDSIYANIATGMP